MENISFLYSCKKTNTDIKTVRYKNLILKVGSAVEKENTRGVNAIKN
tara:strand:+ start:345 stop:485 length:141 start_codon:yes stop_codon:yes gene_type:complete